MAASFILLVALGASSEDMTTRFQLTLRGWFSATDIKSAVLEDVFSDASGVAKQLDLGHEVAPEARLRWQFAPKHGLELRYLYLYNSSDFTLQHPALLSDQASRLKAGVDVSYARLGWHWTIVQPEKGWFRLETIVDVSGGAATVEYKDHRTFWPFSPTTSKTNADVSGVWPTVGLAATLTPLEWFDLFGEISGISGIDSLTLLDYEAGIRVNPFKWLGIEGGYRNLRLDGTDKHKDVDFAFSGPFCGAKLRF